MSITADRALCSPLVTVLDLDFDRLDALASAGETIGHPTAAFLATELERAAVRPANEVGSNVVRMNSRVAFRIEGRRDVQVRTLVYPDEYERRADRDDCISIMTPVGTALLGLRVGTGMSYKAANDVKQIVSVVEVLPQSNPTEHAIATGDGGDGATMPTTTSRHPPNNDGSNPPAA